MSSELMSLVYVRKDINRPGYVEPMTKREAEEYHKMHADRRLDEAPVFTLTNAQYACYLLKCAAELVNGDRNEEYGDFLKNCDLVSQLLQHAVPASGVSKVLANIKLARLENQPYHFDSKVDHVAYAALHMAAFYPRSKPVPPPASASRDGAVAPSPRAG